VVKKRTGRGHAIPDEVLMVLGLGTAMNSYSDEWLVVNWRKWKRPLTARWQANYGEEPFAAAVARMEGWE
jgi:hypothetical protein